MRYDAARSHFHRARYISVDFLQTNSTLIAKCSNDIAYKRLIVAIAFFSHRVQLSQQRKKKMSALRSNECAAACVGIGNESEMWNEG